MKTQRFGMLLLVGLICLSTVSPIVRAASPANHFVSVWVSCRAPKGTKMLDFSTFRLKIGESMIVPVGVGTEMPVNRDSNFNSFEIGAAVFSLEGKLQPTETTP